MSVRVLDEERRAWFLAALEKLQTLSDEELISAAGGPPDDDEPPDGDN